MKGIISIIKKEFLNSIRDKRILYMSIILPVFIYPLFLLLPLSFTNEKINNVKEKKIIVGLFKMEPDSALKTFENKNYAFSSVDSVNVEFIKSGNVDIILSKDSFYNVFYDPEDIGSQLAMERFSKDVETFNKEILEGMLKKVGLSSDWINSVNIKKIPLKKKNISSFYIMLIAFLIMWSVIGSSAVIIEATAGEKERKTLEYLIALPVSRESILIGKIITTFIFGFVSSFLMFLAFSVAFKFFLPQASKSLLYLNSVSFKYVHIIVLIIILTMLSFDMLLTTLSIFAKSIREAQMYMMPISFLLILPIIFMQMFSKDLDSWVYFVPVLNSIVEIKELLIGRFDSHNLLVVILVYVAFIYIFFKRALRSFKSEKAVLRS